MPNFVRIWDQIQRKVQSTPTPKAEKPRFEHRDKTGVSVKPRMMRKRFEPLPLPKGIKKPVKPL